MRAIAALVFLAMAYYFGVWGYFGLFLGESNYRRAGEYRLMFFGGIVSAIIGVFLLIAVFRRHGSSNVRRKQH